MPKDDYIRFRCSSDLKELVGKQAEEKGMNITDYMEYLIRKDGNNMMYIYNTEEMENDLREKIVNNGLAVVFNEDKLISKVEKISIDGKIIKSWCILESWISLYDGGEFLTLTDGVQIGLDDVINTLLDEINLPYDDSGETYAEKIYNAKNPDEELRKIFNGILLTLIDMKMEDFRIKANIVREQVKNGTFKWE